MHAHAPHGHRHFCGSNRLCRSGANPDNRYRQGQAYSQGGGNRRRECEQQIFFRLNLVEFGHGLLHKSEAKSRLREKTINGFLACAHNVQKPPSNGCSKMVNEVLIAGQGLTERTTAPAVQFTKIRICPLDNSVNQHYVGCVLARLRDVALVTIRWAGMRWTLWRQAGSRRPDENAAAYGEVVWSWRRDPGVYPRRPVLAGQR